MPQLINRPPENRTRPSIKRASVPQCEPPLDLDSKRRSTADCPWLPHRLKTAWILRLPLRSETVMFSLRTPSHKRH